MKYHVALLWHLVELRYCILFGADVTCNIIDKHESFEMKLSKIVNSTVGNCIITQPAYQNEGFVEHIKFSRRFLFSEHLKVRKVTSQEHASLEACIFNSGNLQKKFRKLLSMQ